jgi:hypothetical protein
MTQSVDVPFSIEEKQVRLAWLIEDKPRVITRFLNDSLIRREVLESISSLVIALAEDYAMPFC